MIPREELQVLLVDAITDALRLSARSDLVSVPIRFGVKPDAGGGSVTINRKHVMRIEAAQVVGHATRVIMQDGAVLIVAWTYEFTVQQLS